MPRCCLNPKNYDDRKPAKGMIDTYCKVCRKWLGKRPVESKK